MKNLTVHIFGRFIEFEPNMSEDDDSCDGWFYDFDGEDNYIFIGKALTDIEYEDTDELDEDGDAVQEEIEIIKKYGIHLNLDCDELFYTENDTLQSTVSDFEDKMRPLAHLIHPLAKDVL